ncbi:hypothetical protein SAMN02745218_02168 [Desulfofundulus australicus DSM 11792]|jgi:hypothetical protein|uniref:CRISPR type III-B/RAMP module-associated protein Cmr5 n=1 Tax=Desulfofundulus australicus DSM 11792 TaxID=1121425 RepID=A0A1M5BCL4_9FIRM|nr:hypothetical protein [Desulfofundulus australicus]MDK2888110.1 hypothetical protein [Thermoanaerobacter sp.]SHF40249.1 hypothetical protein SAMN02745218_02168 [Desulfofundulus australicus DSM 11792]
MKASETQITDFVLERARKKDLDELKEELARRAADFLKESKPKPKEIGDKQIKNLVAMAQMAATPLEIKAFIEYQMGRDSSGQGWAAEFNGKPFGKALIEEIEEVEKLARDRLKDSNRTADRRFVLLCLAHFFGYLSWRVKYLEYLLKEKSPGKNRRTGGERDDGNR